MRHYSDFWYKSSDGLRLYARDYQHQSPAATIVCIPGLTRNSADFAGLGEHLAEKYRVIAVELRGRGNSDYDSNPENYHPGIYVQDVIGLLDALELKAVILIGTSLGGLISMLLGMLQPERITGMVLNDIGPQVNPQGMERIKAYVGVGGAVADWNEAIRRTREIHGREFPDLSDQQWAAFTRNLYRQDDQGRPVPAYDPAISVLLRQQQKDAVPADLWPVFAAIKDTPILLVRGALSDLLMPECVTEMRRVKPDLQVVEVADRGHAPLLTEPEVLTAIDRFLCSKELSVTTGKA